MALTYEIIRKVDGEIEAGTLEYKTVDGFEDYKLFGDESNMFQNAYNNGDTIKVLEDGEIVSVYQKTEKLYFDKWDNYESDSPERMNAINEVLAALEKHGRVSVSFDYEGRTRHEMAAHVFKETLEKMGHTDLTFKIGYNYEFTIERQ